MTLLRVMLVSSAIIVIAQSIPVSITDLESNSTPETERRGNTDPTLHFTQQPHAMLQKETNSKEEPATVEFIFEDSTKNHNIQRGTNRERYEFNNLSVKKEETEKLKTPDLGGLNIDVTSENKSNITAISKRGDLIAVTDIKRDQWSLTPQELSSIMGGLPKYFYDIMKPIHPFPEINEDSKRTEVNLSKNENSGNFQLPVLSEKLNKPPLTAGPMLHPQSMYTREFDLPFYN